MKNTKKLTIHEYELPITVTQDTTGGYIARCNIWPDCYAQGDSIEEAINELSSVATTLIELYQEENLSIPLKLKHTKQHVLSSIHVTFPLVVSSQ